MPVTGILTNDVDTYHTLHKNISKLYKVTSSRIKFSILEYKDFFIFVTLVFILTRGFDEKVLELMRHIPSCNGKGARL